MDEDALRRVWTRVGPVAQALPRVSVVVFKDQPLVIEDAGECVVPYIHDARMVPAIKAITELNKLGSPPHNTMVRLFRELCTHARLPTSGDRVCVAMKESEAIAVAHFDVARQTPLADGIRWVPTRPAEQHELTGMIHGCIARAHEQRAGTLSYLPEDTQLYLFELE